MALSRSRAADSDQIVVTERISTQAGAGAGTVGQQVDALSDEGFFSTGSILGLRQDAGFRSNVGLFNPEPFDASVTLTLRRADGEVIGEAVVSVPPLGYVQRNLAILFPESPMPEGEKLTLHRLAGVRSSRFAAVSTRSRTLPFSPGLRYPRCHSESAATRNPRSLQLGDPRLKGLGRQAGEGSVVRLASLFASPSPNIPSKRAVSFFERHWRSPRRVGEPTSSERLRYAS